MFSKKKEERLSAVRRMGWAQAREAIFAGVVAWGMAWGVAGCFGTGDTPASASGAASSRAATAAVAGGDDQRVGLALKNAMTRMLDVREEYERKLELMGWTNAMDPQRLRVDPKLAHTKEIVVKAREAVAVYRSRTLEAFGQARHEFELTGGVDEPHKRSLLAAYDEAAERGKALVTQSWDLEEQLVDQVEQLVSLLARNLKGWRAENNAFVFQKASDGEEFNALRNKIQDTAARQKEMQEELVRRSRESLSSPGR